VLLEARSGASENVAFRTELRASVASIHQMLPPEADPDGEWRSALMNRYPLVRRFLRVLVETIEFGATTDAKPVLSALKDRWACWRRVQRSGFRPATWTPRKVAIEVITPSWQEQSRARYADRDPVPPRRAELGVPDALEDAAVALDRLDRGNVVGRADNQHPVHAEHPCLVEHPAQCPSCQPAPARGGPDAVANVAGPLHEVAEPVAQRDPAEHPVALDDPPVRARLLTGLHRRGLIRLGGQPRYPGRKPGWRVDLIGREQPETVLVETGSPLGMRLEPGSMQTCGRRDQVGYTGILSIQVAYEQVQVGPSANAVV